MTSTASVPVAAPTPVARHHSRRRHGVGFWVVALAFLTVMAFSTVPAPLYGLYEAKDHFPTFTVTIVFAAYSVGVTASLYLAGHLSDTVGRRRMILLSIALEVVSAVLFLVWNELPGLLVARLICGFGIGTLTASATAHLGELRVAAREDPTAAVSAGVVSGVANIGGLGLGPLVGGALAEFVARPLVTPYVIFIVLLIAAFVAVLAVPETVASPAVRTPYRPQRVALPGSSRGVFWSAALAAVAAFALFGLFTSVAPTFLANTFGVTDRLAAGAVTFGVFTAAAVTQVALARLPIRRQLQVGIALMTIGLVALAVGAVVVVLWVFLVGAVVAGGGVGLVFRAALATAGGVAEPGHRGEVLAATFLVAYSGLSVPVLLVGAALLVVPALPVLVGFVVVVLVLALLAGRRMLRR